MEVGEFLQVLRIAKNVSGPRYPDGSGGQDGLGIYLDIEGHGEPLRAVVDVIRIRPCGSSIYVQAISEKTD